MLSKLLRCIHRMYERCVRNYESADQVAAFRFTETKSAYQRAATKSKPNTQNVRNTVNGATFKKHQAILFMFYLKLFANVACLHQTNTDFLETLERASMPVLLCVREFAFVFIFPFSTTVQMTCFLN